MSNTGSSPMRWGRRPILCAVLTIAGASTALGCGPAPDEGLTGLIVNVRYSPDLTVTQHRFTLFDGANIVGHSMVFPQPPRTLSPTGESLEIIVDDHLVDRDVSLRVDGLRGQEIKGSMREPIPLATGVLTEIDLLLGDPATCGDDETTAPTEECDDRNREDGDGCTAFCLNERG